MPEPDPLLSYKSVQRVIEAMRSRRGGDPAQSSEESFLIYLKRYLKFYEQEVGHSVTPDMVILERKSDWASQDDDVRRKHEEIVKRFQNMLRAERRCPHCRCFGVSPETKKCVLCGETPTVLSEETCSSGRVAAGFNAVRAFYKSNYRALEELIAPTIITETQFKVPSRKEWQGVMNICDYLKKPELKVWILCDKDSGMRVNDLCNLTGNELSPNGTVLQQLRKGICPIHIRIIGEKTKTSGLGFYDCAFGEESVEALQTFLTQQSRRFFTRGISAIEKDFIQVMKVYNRELAKKAKNGETVTYWSDFTPKACRHWFSSELKFAKIAVKEEYVMGLNAVVEYMMGHSIKRQEGAYIVEKLRDHPEELMEIYKAAYHALAFDYKKPKKQ